MHISLDLETWGKRPGCDIRSIGAVVFDPFAIGGSRLPLKGEPVGPDGRFHFGSDGIGETFYIATENPTYEIAGYFDGMGGRRKYPLTRDPETVQWWSDQSPEAQAAFANPVDLRDACERFTHWFNSQATEMLLVMPPKPKVDEIRIWANGPQFDVSILEAVYHAVGLPVPWHYRAPRDFRTITDDAAGMTREEFSNYGDAHNALHDAIAQAMTICEAFKRLRR